MNQLFDRRVAWTVAVSAIILSAYLYFSAGEWKPTGDGRTVVNSRTGEIRDTKTGRRIDPADLETKQRHNAEIVERIRQFCARHPTLPEGHDYYVPIGTDSWDELTLRFQIGANVSYLDVRSVGYRVEGCCRLPQFRNNQEFAGLIVSISNWQY